MSSSSPAKNRPGHTLLAIVLKLTSPSFTPPQVTNSSRFRLLPLTENSVRRSCCANAWAWGPGQPRPARLAGQPRRQNQLFPQPRRQRCERDIDHQFGPRRLPARLELPQDLLRVPVRQPVHGQRELVVQIVQGARAPGRHFQDRRTAQAPMGDQQRLRARAAWPPGRTAPPRPTPRPANAATGAAICRVNSEGTGGTNVCPNPTANCPATVARQPPVASNSRSPNSVSPLLRVNLNRPSAVLPAVSTPQCGRKTTPAAPAADNKQSTIVCAESVAGNIRPSASVFKTTPRAANQATVSRAENWWNGPSRAAPGIAGGKLARVKAGVRHIAAAAARNAHLVEQAAGFFQHCHDRPAFCGRDGGKRPRRAPTHNHHARRMHKTVARARLRRDASLPVAATSPRRCASGVNPSMGTV